MDATKPEIKAAVEGLFKVKVKAVNTLHREGQDQAFPRPARRAERLEEGDRLAGRGSQDRRDHGPVGRGTTMALKTYKPITPSLRAAGHRRPFGPVEGQAGQGADRGQAARPAAATTTAASPAATWAAGTSAATAWSTSSAASSTSPATVERLEYDPNRIGLHRADQVRGRRARLHPGAAAPEGGRRGGRRASGSTSSRATPCRCGNMPVGTIVHNVELKTGEGGQLARSAGTYAQLVGKDAGYAQIKLSSGELRLVPGRVHGHDRRGLQPGQPEHRHRQGRPQALAGPPPARSRRRHEPGRPSARRRRRPHLGRPPSGHAVGQADQGQEDPQEQGDGQVHHPPPSARRADEETDSGTFRLEGSRSSTASLLKKAEKARQTGRNEVIKTWSRRSTILPQFVGLTFGVYNGQKFIPVQRHREDGRSQARRVLADPHLHTATRATRRSRRSNRDEQAKPIPAARRTTRPRPCCAPSASARASSTSWPPADPRQEGGDGA